jgi:hypothetical protein
MKKKYFAENDFIHSAVGSLRAGEHELEESKGVKELVENGYLKEYKTKVVQRKPAKPKKEKVTKKKVKK